MHKRTWRSILLSFRFNIKKKLKNILPKSEFAKNVLTLMTGTTIAQAIPVAISPILTRIYTPEDFGVLTLFLAITTIFGSIANGRYELAVMLPEDDEEAINIFALGVLIVTFLSVTLFGVVIFFKDYFVSLLDNKEIGFWLYFVPLTVFFIGLFNMLNYYNNRIKKYKDLAKAKVIKSVILSVLQVCLGLVKKGALGLITGQIASQLFANIKLISNISDNKKLLASIHKDKIKRVAKRYERFPKFSMWAVLCNTLSFKLTEILISTLYSITTLGFYSLVGRVLAMPSTLIGGAIGQVFFQEATKEKHTTGKAEKVFKRTLKKLLLIGTPFFLILFFIVEELFAFVFGEEWRIAGYYAKILIPMFYIRFIVGTLSNIVNVFEQQIFSLLWQFVLLVIFISILSLSSYLNFSFEKSLIWIAFITFLHYLLLLYCVRRISIKGKL